MMPPFFSPQRTAEAPVYFAQFQEALNVYETDIPDWYGIPDLFGTGQDGYIQRKHIRLWEPATIPVEVDDNNIWIDVHLPEQTLALYKGETPLFVTLISSAETRFFYAYRYFSLYSKATSWDLGSLPSAQEAYFHGACPVGHALFFHDTHSTQHFGMPILESHPLMVVSICLQEILRMSLKTQPILPKGWWVVRHDDNDLGSVVRIRKGSTKAS